MDADLAHALGDVLGLKVKVVNATFDSIIPGITPASTTSGCPRSPTPRSARVVDFVTYFRAGTGFYVTARRPDDHWLATSAATTVAVEGHVPGRRRQGPDASARRRQGGVTVSSSRTRTPRTWPCSSGRAEVGMADSPSPPYIVNQSKGQFKLVGTSTGRRPTASRSRREPAWPSQCSTR